MILHDDSRIRLVKITEQLGRIVRSRIVFDMSSSKSQPRLFRFLVLQICEKNWFDCESLFLSLARKQMILSKKVVPNFEFATAKNGRTQVLSPSSSFRFLAWHARQQQQQEEQEHHELLNETMQLFSSDSYNIWAGGPASPAGTDRAFGGWGFHPEQQLQEGGGAASPAELQHLVPQQSRAALIFLDAIFFDLYLIVF